MPLYQYVSQRKASANHHEVPGSVFGRLLLRLPLPSEALLFQLGAHQGGLPQKPSGRLRKHGQYWRAGYFLKKACLWATTSSRNLANFEKPKESDKHHHLRPLDPPSCLHT